MAQFSKTEVIAKAQFAALLGASVVVTGLWAWATFSGIPSEDIRAQLKSEGYVWCKHKRVWAFRGKPCASKRDMPWDYIKAKYGEEEVTV